MKSVAAGILICALSISGVTGAQPGDTDRIAGQFFWAARFDGVADNREYFNAVTIPQSILGARLSGTLGWQFEQVHTVRFGGSLIQEYGSEFAVDKAIPLAWYSLNARRSHFVFGIFPRTMLGTYPRALLNDTLLFYRPQVEGALFRVRGPWGDQAGWLDWTSRQTDANRETFLCGFEGVVRYRRLFVRNAFIYYHFAGPRIRIPNDHVRDNGGATLAAGVTLENFWRFDTVQTALGGLGSYDRTRGVTDWLTAKGGTALFYASAPRFSIRYEQYFGDPHKLDWGDGFFKASRYGRVDMGVVPILHKSVTGRFIYSLHLIDNHIDHQQAFYLTAELGQTFSRQQRAGP